MRVAEQSRVAVYLGRGGFSAYDSRRSWLSVCCLVGFVILVHTVTLPTISWIWSGSYGVGHICAIVDDYEPYVSAAGMFVERYSANGLFRERDFLVDHRGIDEWSRTLWGVLFGRIILTWCWFPVIRQAGRPGGVLRTLHLRMRDDAGMFRKGQCSTQFLSGRGVAPRRIHDSIQGNT